MAYKSTEGVTLSGARLRVRTKNGCGSGETRILSTEGARQFLLNLSGKRTENIIQIVFLCVNLRSR